MPESGVNFLARVIAWCIIGAVVLVALAFGWVTLREGWR